ncbi:Nn.00g042410.m01.CDS01 [Neocucurbitaria sp. VM-36]
MARPPPRKRMQLLASPNLQASAAPAPEHKTFTQPTNPCLDSEFDDSTAKLSRLCRRCEQIDFRVIFNPTQSILYTNGQFVMALDTLVLDTYCSVCRLFEAVAFKSRAPDNNYHLRLVQTAEQTEHSRPNLALAVFFGRNKGFWRDFSYIDERHAALSYVWGTSLSQNAQFSSQSLPSCGVCQVIEDAIAVVKSLGKRYLWVDQYCIDQQNHDVKDQQIREMDKVYARAYATIIACEGSNADYGLPGVSQAREVQPSAILPDIELFSTLPTLYYAIKETTWLTRGWTYQEAVLSRRCLFFTNRQVYFVCPEMESCESIVRQYATQSGPQEVYTAFNANVLQATHHTEEGTSLQKFADHITAYSSRHLTYEEDILDAFRGLLTRSPFYTYYGIPIALENEPRQLDDNINSYSIGLARGLSWRPHRGPGSLTRRKGFPSWSWVGWKGAVEYLFRYRNSSVNNMDVASFDTRFWAKGTNGELLSFQTLANDLHDTWVIPEQSHCIAIKARVFQFTFRPEGLDKDKRDAIEVCTCPSDGKHLGFFNAEGERRSAIFFEQLEENDAFYRRVFSENWDCVLLFASTGGRKLLLIIDWIEDMAHVVGNLRLDNLDNVPCRRRTIQLE